MATPEFDPYQLEADDLERMSKLLQARMLRAPVQSIDPGAMFMDTVERGQAPRQLKDLEARRRKLGEEYLAGINTAVSGGTPQSLMSSPATRAMGLELLKRKMQQDQDEAAQRQVFGGGQPGPALPGATSAAQGIFTMEQLLQLANHPNPSVAGRAKTLLEQFYPKNKKTNELYPQPGGGYALDPAAGPAISLAERSKAEAAAAMDIVEVPIGGGRTQRMTRADAVRRMGGGQPPPMQGQQPPMQGTGMPGPGGASFGTVSPQVQQERDMAALQMKRQELEQSLAMGDQQGADAIRREIELYQGGRPPPAPRTAPQGEFGVSDPETAKRRELTMGIDKDQVKQYVDKGAAATATKRIAQNLLQSSDGGKLFEGKLADFQVALNQVGASLGVQVDPKAVGSEAYYAKLQELLRERIKALGSGTGISNLDLLTTERGLPQLANTAAGRKMILEALIKDSEIIEVNGRLARNAFEDGNYRDFKPVNFVDDEKSARQELRAKLGTTSALPGAAASVVKKPPDPWAGEGAFQGALVNSVKALLNPFNVGGVVGGYADAQKNLVTGAGQRLGLSEPADYAPIKAEQEAKMGQEPGYAQGKVLGETAGPLDILPAGTLLKAAGGAGLKSFLEPQTEGTNMSRALPTALAATMGAAGKWVGDVLPSTKIPSGMGVAEGTRLPNVPLTVAQRNPGTAASWLQKAIGTGEGAAPVQAAALSNEVAREAGLSGRHITQEAIDGQREKLMSEVKKLVTPAKISLKQDPGIEALRERARSDPNIQSILSDPRTGPDFKWINAAIDGATVTKVSAEQLDRTIQQIGTIAKGKPPGSVDAIREYLTNTLKTVMGPKKYAEYEAKWNQIGKVNELDKAFAQGKGAGTGELAGTLIPSRLPPGSPADRMAKAYGIDDPLDYAGRIPGLNQGLLDMIRSAVGTVGRPMGRAQVSPANQARAYAGINADPQTQMMIELLRATPTAAARGAIGAQDAP